MRYRWLAGALGSMNTLGPPIQACGKLTKLFWSELLYVEPVTFSAGFVQWTPSVLVAKATPRWNSWPGTIIS